MTSSNLGILGFPEKIGGFSLFDFLEGSNSDPVSPNHTGLPPPSPNLTMIST